MAFNNRNNFRTYRDPNKKKFNLYEFLSGDRNQNGVSKEDRITDYNLINFFKLYFRNFGKIVGLNLLYLLGNFPVLFYLFARSGNVSQQTLAPVSTLFAPLHGVALSGGTDPVTCALLGIYGYRTVSYVPTAATYVFMGLAALVVFTFGIVNAGTAYLQRNMVRCEPVFFFQDFLHAVKRNWKQALPFGIIDCIWIALLFYDIYFFYYNIGPFINNVFFYLILACTVFSFVMRFYLYLMMVTFDLSIPKLIKNAFIFSIIGIKRNILAILGMALFCAACYAIFTVYVPLGALLPIFLMISTMTFMATYAAYPKIKEIMIDPYEAEHPKDPEPEQEDAVFRDRG
ncbi:MAG: YesL family protein [Clostridia bacterium]|nr:YesL family protein [Clostridia bacterium]